MKSNKARFYSPLPTRAVGNCWSLWLLLLEGGVVHKWCHHISREVGGSKITCRIRMQKSNDRECCALKCIWHKYFLMKSLSNFTNILSNFSQIHLFPVTDYGCPIMPFFIKSQTFGLGQTIWADNLWGIWGIFGQFIITHFGTVSPLSMFSNNQPLFLQKTKPLYPNPKYLFGIGIRIWIWTRKN